MSYYQEKSIAERLSQAQELIVNAQADTELSEILARLGLDETAFAEGQRRLDAAGQLETSQQVKLGAQVAATATLTDTFKTLRRLFRQDRELIRNIVRDQPALYEELRLHIRTKTSREAFLRQATHFYTEVVTNVQVLALLATLYNVTPEKFENRKVHLNETLAAMQVQQSRIGEAQVATQRRRTAMKELDDWVSNVIRIARVAFRNDARQLKKLGLQVKERA